MAKVLSTGSTKNHKDSAGKRLGFKVFPESFVIAGGIILRQRGSEWHSWRNTTMGRDFTINATVTGRVKTMKRRWYRGQTLKVKRYLYVEEV